MTPPTGDGAKRFGGRKAAIFNGLLGTSTMLSTGGTGRTGLRLGIGDLLIVFARLLAF
jgi:hypothetical protein